MFRSFLMSRKGLRTIVLAATLGLVLAPVAAEARAGSGGSFGSGGSRTFSAPPTTPTAPRSTSPIERSTTPSATQSAAPFPNRASAPASSGIGRGFIGGLIGAGLLGALFGAGFFGGLGSLMSILGLILQIGLLILVARLAYNWFTRRRMQPATAAAGAAPSAARSYESPAARMGAASPSRPSAVPTLGPDDFSAFERSLVLVQQASTNEDVASLRNLATPEMVSIFQEEIAEYARKGVANKTGGTTLLQGDLAETWSEGNVEFASVAMRFSMTDTMVDRTTGKLVAGDPLKPVEATEIWTFQRQQGGRPDGWRLSAIQQAS